MKWACFLLVGCSLVLAQNQRRVGPLRETFSWRQMAFNIDGKQITADLDRFDGIPPVGGYNARPPTATAMNNTDLNKFFVQYNNLPMGVERWRNKLFVTIPRRRFGIPSTLNYLDLDTDINIKSPGLRPYPNLVESRSLVSVYRTRADSCNRLWMVDNGLIEIPDDLQQLQPPGIVVYDLNTDKQLFRYNFKPEHIPSPNTPAGLASVTVELVNGDCNNAYAYIPDLTTYGIIVYSLRDNDSWRITHDSFFLQPTAGNLDIAGQRFSWSDGIFSITLSTPDRQTGDRTAFYHALVSNQEFAVSTRVLKNQTLATRSYHGEDFYFVGERGRRSHCTIADYHAGSGAIFYGEVSTSSLSCWNTNRPLSPETKVTLAQDDQRLVYIGDVHVTGDEVWTIVNSLPRWIYSTLDRQQDNFIIYSGSIPEMISGTSCDRPRGA